MKERGVEGYSCGRKRPQRTEIIKNKAWRYSLKSFIIINLGSLKMVGDKKRAVKKKIPVMSLPGRRRWSSPLRARRIPGLSFLVFLHWVRVWG